MKRISSFRICMTIMIIAPLFLIFVRIPELCLYKDILAYLQLDSNLIEGKINEVCWQEVFTLFIAFVIFFIYFKY